jgi:pseudouridine kinase
MKELTTKEQEVFDLICDNPQISQDELAKILNITRSSVSVHISNLLKKRYIEGKGYIVNRKDKLVVIGASMIDIVGRSKNSLIHKDSNPGHIRVSAGGVSRNISENLSRLGAHVSLLTAICDDSFGQMIKDSCIKSNVDISEAYLVHGESTTTYIAILDETGDMDLALSDTAALDKIPVDYILKKDYVLKGSEIIVVDAVLPSDVMDVIGQKYGSTKRIFIDPVSVGKAKSIKDKLHYFDTLKCNRLEAEYLSDVKINNNKDVEKAAAVLIDKGIKCIYITLGVEGVYYRSPEATGFMKTVPTTIQNATGAGDAFMAGLVFSKLNGFEEEDCVRFALTCASIAIESPYTVNPNISYEMVKERLKK